MKKKLLTLAVAAALPMAAQAANAEVTIYGKIHASIDYLSADQADRDLSGSNDSLWDVTSRASRLGFKGSEDLGDGLKLIWKLESGIDVTGGSGGLSARNRYIGLAGGWGTFLYGIHDTPMKMSTGKLDIFGDTIADYNLQGKGVGTGGFVDIRAQDAIAYVSPSFAGLTLVGAIVPDADSDYGEVVKEQGDFAGAYSLAAMYSNGGLFLAGAYESLDDVLGGADASHWRIGAGFDFGAFHIGGVYSDVDGTLGGFTKANGKSNDYKVYTINGSWTFGNNVLKAMWLNTDWDGDIPVYKDNALPGSDDSTSTWAIGLDHNFSKRTKAYVIYANSDMALNGSNFNMVGAFAREQDAFSMGMVHKF